MTKRITKIYPLEFKQSSAKLAAESKQPISETAKSLGVNATTLYGWVEKFHPRIQSDTQKKDSAHEEVKHLLLENARLKQERDILKKAAACVL